MTGPANPGGHATLIGGHGFIGSHLARQLTQQGVPVQMIGRGDASWRDADLGRVFYCAGLTADFRTRPFDTIAAHVSFIADILRSARFVSLVYLSSTRVYGGAGSTDEQTRLSINPNDPSDLYNISKLAGEAVCLSSGRANVRVARLSNVYGGDTASENFLTSILRDALSKGHIDLGTDLASAKDYVSIDDVVGTLDAISRLGSERIINVASGRNTTHGALVEKISRLTGCTVSVKPGVPVQTFPPIAVARMTALVGGSRGNVLDHIEIEIAKIRSMNRA